MCSEAARKKGTGMARTGYMGNRNMTIGWRAAMLGKGFGGVVATKGERKGVA
jgi:hypothetical protein